MSILGVRVHLNSTFCRSFISAVERDTYILYDLHSIDTVSTDRHEGRTEGRRTSSVFCGGYCPGWGTLWLALTRLCFTGRSSGLSHRLFGRMSGVSLAHRLCFTGRSSGLSHRLFGRKSGMSLAHIVVHLILTCQCSSSLTSV